jgi:hypothetical protein
MFLSAFIAFLSPISPDVYLLQIEVLCLIDLINRTDITLHRSINYFSLYFNKWTLFYIKIYLQ